jgi:hypothetical protein
MRIKYNHLLYILFLPWVVVFILRALGPINYQPVSTSFLLFALIFLMFGAAGYIFGLSGIGFDCKREPRYERNDLDLEFKLVLFLSLMYTVLTFADFFILKGGTLSSITLVREEDNLVGARMSLLGGLIAITSAAPFILLCKIRHERILSNQSRGVFIVLLAIIGIATSFLSGGRNAFLIGMVVYFVQGLLLKGGGRIPDAAKNNTVKLFIFVGILFSFYLFVDRELNQGVDVNQLLSIFAAKWSVQIDEIQTDNIFFGSIYAATTIFIFYFTHALNFIDQYFIENASPALMGAYNFPIPSKIIDIFFDSNISSSVSGELLVPGVYLTLPGSLYVDFGYFGTIVFGFLIGVVTGFAYRLSMRRSFLRVQFVSFMICMWLLAPLYSVIGISNGFSFLAIITFLFLIKSIMKLKFYAN